MKKISIHIGLPKTATTYIQKTLSLHNSYFGLESDKEIFSENLFRIFVKYSRGESVESHLVYWWHQINDYVDKSYAEFPLVFSSEYFFSGHINGFPEFPFAPSTSCDERLMIADFLNLMSKVLSPHVSIGVVLTLRNQPEWLASKYAQATPCILNASQTDFEKRVKYFASLPNKLWCNWGSIVDQIDRAIGKENVLVVCMEDINKDHFWNDISTFCFGLDTSLKFDALSESVNAKKVSDTEWGLRRFRPGSYFASCMSFIPGTLLYESSRRFDNLLVKSRIIKKSKRRGVISLSQSVISNCLLTCGEGNTWLSHRLEKDLADIGYPIKKR